MPCLICNTKRPPDIFADGHKGYGAGRTADRQDDPSSKIAIMLISNLAGSARGAWRLCGRVNDQDW